MVATRFAVAIHILLLIARRQDAPETSQRLARSINTNPVVVRRIAGMLARAGLIHIRRGPGGAELLRPASAISLGDVWGAVNPGRHRPLLPVHKAPQQNCPVGSHIRLLLGEAFTSAEAALQEQLARTTLAGLVDRLDPISAERINSPCKGEVAPRETLHVVCGQDEAHTAIDVSDLAVVVLPLRQ